MPLPNPGMTFTPFDPLTAAELNDIVENVEALAAGPGLDDGAVTSIKLSQAFFRGRQQLITTNSSPTGLTVQYGWSFIPGTGADEATKTITFPTAFSSAPVYIMTSVFGYATSTPTAITDFTNTTGSAPFSSSAYNITTTNFICQISRSDAVTFTSSIIPGFSWMAIGVI